MKNHITTKPKVDQISEINIESVYYERHDEKNHRENIAHILLLL